MFSLTIGFGAFAQLTVPLKVGSSGNIGIGTENPIAKLHVNGNIYMPMSTSFQIGSTSALGERLSMHYAASAATRGAYIDYLPVLRFRAGETTMMTLNSNGNVGIGNHSTNPIDPMAPLDVMDVSHNKIKSILARTDEHPNAYLSVKTYDNTPYGRMFAIEHIFYNVLNSSIEFMRGGGTYGGRIKFRVHTGTEIANFNNRGLDVLGVVAAKQFKATLTDWADFVFADNYNLPSLSEVKFHIKEHKHLPDIPSEKEVKEKGVDLGEMQAKLLQKIEELTLYAIQQQETIEKQQEMMNELKKEVDALKNNK